jgi:SAM-dependent methyltransferase
MEDPYHWDDRVEAWEEVAQSPAFLALRDIVCERAQPRQDDLAVDLGAGTGLIALALAPYVSTMAAVDVSGQMLERLEWHADADGIDNVRAVEADLRSLPLDDESVTLAVSNYAFHHLEHGDKELALAEVRRVLVPGGRLVVCDMMFSLSLEPRNRALVWAKVAAIARRGPAGLLRLVRNAGRVAVGRWEHPATPETWEQLLRRRRFSEIEIELLEHEAGLATAVRPPHVRDDPGTRPRIRVGTST